MLKLIYIFILKNGKGSFISFQLVLDTPGSDFPPPNNPKFENIKKIKSFLKIWVFLSCQILGCWEEENLSLEWLALTETR